MSMCGSVFCKQVGTRVDIALRMDRGTGKRKADPVRPAAVKGAYVRKVSVSATMSPGITLDVI